MFEILGHQPQSIFRSFFTMFTLIIQTPYVLTIVILKSNDAFYYRSMLSKTARLVTNCADPDQIQVLQCHSLDLHCLHRPVCPNISCKYNKLFEPIDFQWCLSSNLYSVCHLLANFPLLMAHLWLYLLHFTLV